MVAALATVSNDVLHAELRRRAARVRVLMKKRAKAAREVERLAGQIAALGGAVSAGGGGGGRKGGGGPRLRAKNAMTLTDALKAMLKGKTMGVSEAAAAIQKAGYKTHSRHFRTMVNIALTNKSNFKRVSRGQYTAK